MATKAKSEIKQLKFKVPIIVESDTPGFHSYSPALKGLHMDGDTEKEALHSARIAARLYLKSMIEHGDSIRLGVQLDKKSQLASKRKKGYYIEDVTVKL